LDNSPELKDFADEFRKSLYLRFDDDEVEEENPVMSLMNAEDPNKVLDIISVQKESKSSLTIDFLRTSLFYLTNFPQNAYSNIDLNELNDFFKIISKKISRLCHDNESFIHIMFCLFNLYQKTGGISFNYDLIKNYILKRNMNVHYDLMTPKQLVNVSLYLSVIFRDSKEEFISYFNEKILANLEPQFENLKSTEISQLMIMFMNFEYKK
jgi:hypothetical protein